METKAHDPEARYNLGWGYTEQEDYANAARCYLEAAEQEFAMAQYALGLNYEEGKGVPRDNRKAISWYERAAGQGDAAAQDRLVRMCENEVLQGVEALRILEKIASHGNPEAQYYLGWMYKNGDSVEKNPVKAAEFYTLSAMQEDEAAQRKLGKMYRKGIGVTQDAARSEQYFKQFNEKNCPELEY